MSSIQIYFDQDRAFFVEEVTPFLEKNEAVNAMMLGLCFAMHQGSFADKKIELIRITKDGELNSVAIKESKSSLVLTFISEEEIVLLIQTLMEKSIPILKVLDPLKSCERFAEIWSKKMNVNARLSMKQKIYQLDKVNDLEFVDGAMALADERDRELLVQWFYEMVKEAIPYDDLTLEGAQDWVDKKISNNALFLWIQNDVPVSMAALTGATRCGVRISAVYTPPQFRRKGMATSLVGNLSQHVLNEVAEKCFLYTDQINLTSNGIYQKIGFNPVCESVLYVFEPNL